jgi:DNA-binding CsgD family transcriptional regulator
MSPGRTSTVRLQSLRIQTSVPMSSSNGSAELSSGLPGAIDHLEEAHTLVQGEQRAAEFALALANARFAEDFDVFEAADGLRRAIESVDPIDATLAQRLEAELIMWARFDVRLYTDWLEIARKRRSAFAFAHASSFRALAFLRRGDLAEAEADARAALAVPFPLAHTYPHLAEVLAERGELAEAIRTLDLAGVPDESQPTWQTAVLLEPRARLRIASGEVERGLAELIAAGERMDAFGVRNPSYSAWRSHAALVLSALGDRTEASRLVDEEVELARHWGTARPLGVALRATGLVQGGNEGIELMRESVSVLATSQAQLERAKSFTELGAALRRANHRRSARSFLEEGLELAHRCGATTLAERAHTELIATGARPRRLVRSGVDSLTPTERRVAQMAKNGQTNREIAQALFVTPKTVETHLSHVYRKLEIQARSQLPGAMSESSNGSE